MIDVFPLCYKLFSNDQPANPFGFLVCQFHMSLHMSNRLLVAFQPNSWKMNESLQANNECVCSSFIIGFISDITINQTIWNNHLFGMYKSPGVPDHSSHTDCPRHPSSCQLLHGECLYQQLYWTLQLLPEPWLLYPCPGWRYKHQTCVSLELINWIKINWG